MFINERIKITPHNKYLQYYRDLGYPAKYRTEIEIETKDLVHTAATKVHYKCDYCGEVCEVSSKDYWRRKEGREKDCCKNCAPIKREEIIFAKTGYHSPLSNPKIREKIKKTNLERRGTEWYLGSKEQKEKLKKYCEKYGVTNVMHIPEIKEKIKNTMLEKYGVECNLLLEDGKEDRIRNSMASKIANGTFPTSKGQNELHEIIGGENNKLINLYCVDIYFKEEQIYIEYDGSGHNLSVKQGKITEEAQKKKDLIRYFILKKEGLKEIVFKNPKDKKLNSELILFLKEFAFVLLRGEESKNKDFYNRIVFNLDTQKIETKYWECSFEELKNNKDKYLNFIIENK